MDSPCFLGIDFGTGGARAAVIDEAGNTLAEERELFAGDSSPEAWRFALFDLIGRLPASLRGNLQAIAIDGTSGTVLLCREDNEPAAGPLMYDDTRAKAEAGRLSRIAPPGHVVLSPASSLAKLLWFAGQPDYGRARFFLHQADWLASLLHGRPGVSDYHNCLKLGYDPARGAYPEWLRNLPVAPLLPHVVAPGVAIAPVLPEIARRFDLPAGCLVRAGTTDSIAAFIASGARRPGQAVTSLGSTLVLKLLSTTRVEASQYGVYSHRLGNLWLAGGASNTGGTVLRQFFTDAQLETLSARIDPSRPSGLDYYPLPARGERFPVNDPEFPPRLSPRPENNVQFLHGLLEGIARIEAEGYRLLRRLGASPLESVLTAGGGARNPVWTAIRAKQLGVPVYTSDHTEACYGAALLAARGEKLLS